MKLSNRKFNGCSHDIFVYKKEDYRSGRNGGYYLINENAQPIEVIRQDRTLNAREKPYVIQMEETPIFVPEAGTDQLDVPENFTEFSTIIVSPKYAELSRRVMWWGVPRLRWFGEYADRLYTPVPVKNAAGEICGCVGLRKVFPVKTPQEYAQNIRAGQFSQSYHAVKMAVEKFRAYAVNDVSMQIAIRELEAAISETEAANTTAFSAR